MSASYALVHDKVSIGEIVSTRMAGAPELMEIESAFAKVLKSVDSFHVQGQELELLQDGKVVATFETKE